MLSCGDSIFQSIAATSAADGYVVGVDIDLSSESDTVVNSAMKGLFDDIEWVIAKFYEGVFADIGSIPCSPDTDYDVVGLPTDFASWRFETYTIEQYEESFAAVKSGELTIDNAVIDAEAISAFPFAKGHIEYV